MNYLKKVGLLTLSLMVVSLSSCFGGKRIVFVHDGHPVIAAKNTKTLVKFIGTQVSVKQDLGGWKIMLKEHFFRCAEIFAKKTGKKFDETKANKHVCVILEDKKLEVWAPEVEITDSVKTKGMYAVHPLLWEIVKESL